MRSNIRNSSTVLVLSLILCGVQLPAHAQGNTTGSSSAGTEGARQRAKASLASSKQDFIQQALETNQAERAMAQLALEQAFSTDVKAYAQQMLQDHTQANKELEALREKTTSTATSGDRTQMRTRSTTASGNTNRRLESVDYRTDTTGSESGLGTAASPAVGSRMGMTEPTGDPAPGMGSDAYKAYGQLSEKHQVSINRMKSLSGSQFDQEYLAAQLTNHEQAIYLYEQQVSNGKDTRLREYARKQLPSLRNHLQQARRISDVLKSSNGDKGSN